jgi:hypothetical protein
LQARDDTPEQQVSSFETMLLCGLASGTPNNDLVEYRRSLSIRANASLFNTYVPMMELYPRDATRLTCPDPGKTFERFKFLSRAAARVPMYVHMPMYYLRAHALPAPNPMNMTLAHYRHLLNFYFTRTGHNWPNQEEDEFSATLWQQVLSNSSHHSSAQFVTNDHTKAKQTLVEIISPRV